MNILPKKRWHVRTKENIARVRRDEAEARKIEEQREHSRKYAESEARINFLRKQTGFIPDGKDVTEDTEASVEGHVNLFKDYKAHTKEGNKDLAKEKKEEQEKYEKQIGLLTFLGQDTNEALRLRSWYEVPPKRLKTNDDSSEKDVNAKHSQDPLTLIKAFFPPEVPTERRTRICPEKSIYPTVSHKLSQNVHKTFSKEKRSDKKETKKHKHRKKKKEKSKKKDRDESNRKESERKEKIDKLRKERLRREQHERLRQEALLAPKSIETNNTTSEPVSKFVQKYNSQFNPEIAKQNMN